MICAGGRRLSALTYLFEQERIATDFEFPVLIVSEEVATEVSLVENSGRVEMHPADEFLAFKRMIDEQGKTVEQVATAFGVAPLTVERRLKLARVAPMFIDLYRKGEVQMDQLQVLVLIGDQDHQVKLWKSLPNYHRSAYRLKEAITEGQIDVATHHVAKYVGVDAYTKAGGIVTGDLFNEGHGYIDNIELLNSLATEKISKSVKKLEKEGAKFVEVRLEGDRYNLQQEYVSVPLTMRELTKKEAAERQKLTAALETAERKCAEADESGEEEDIDAADDAKGAAEKTLFAFDAKCKVPDPRYAEKVGAVLFIDRNGKLDKLTNVIHRDEIKKIKAVEAGQNPDAIQKQGRPAHSERLMRLLTAHRTAAIQAAMLNNPAVALAATVAAQMERVFKHYSDLPVKISLTSPTLSSCDENGTLLTSRANIVISEAQTKWQAIYEAIEGNAFEWALQQSQETLLELLAYCTSYAFTSVQGTDNGTNDFAPYMKALDVNMAQWWKPTADTYLNFVSKDKILETVTEAVGAQEAQSMTSHKKAALIGAAQAKIEETGWIPAIFRI